MNDYDRIKIVVSGDSGVGKTAFVHLLCYGEALLYPSWTIGCSIELMIYPRPRPGWSGQSIMTEDHYFVEFWDIGGSGSHANTRSVFYDNINGIILVHDLTNKKSEANLPKWLTEITSKGGSFQVVCNSADNSMVPSVRNFIRTSTQIPILFSSSTTSFMSQSVPPPNSPSPPVLVVGTKLDQIRPSAYPSSSYLPLWSDGRQFEVASSSRINTTSFAASRAFPEIAINCNSSSSLAEHSHNDNTISAFLQKVIHFKRCNDGVGKRGQMNQVAATTSIPSFSNRDVASLPFFGRRFGDAITYRMPNT